MPLVLAIAALAVVAAMVFLALGSMGGGGGLDPTGPAPPAGSAGGSTVVCNSPNPSPSALRVSVAGPTRSIDAGGSLTVEYEVTAVNASRGALPTTVYVPSVTAIFPRAPSGTYSIFLGPHTFTLNATGWGSPGAVAQTRTLTAKLSFPSSSTSYVTSQKIAVMARDGYGSITLGFRWEWSEVPHSGNAALTGSWSTPALAASSPDLPSEFYPAPYVAIVGMGGTTLAPGTNFTAQLSGAVANTTFRVVVEYPNNGTEITSRWESTPVAATTFNATAPMTYANGAPLPAGKYLVHLHDHCQAILHSISVTVT